VQKRKDLVVLWSKLILWKWWTGTQSVVSAGMEDASSPNTLHSSWNQYLRCIMFSLNKTVQTVWSPCFWLPLNMEFCYRRQDKSVLWATPIGITVIVLCACVLMKYRQKTVQEFLSVVYKVTNDLCRVPNLNLPSSSY